MSKILLGAKAPTGEELSLLTHSLATLVLDEAVLEKMAAGLGSGRGPSACPATAPAAPPAGTPLTVAQSRAAVLGALSQLLQGRSGVQPAVCRALAARLNAGTVPAFPSSASLATSVAGLLFDGTTCDGVPAFTVTVGDVAGIVALSGPAAAIAAVAAYGLSSSLIVADAIAALAVEAAQGSVAPYDTDFNDHARRHPGILASAGNIRGLLENSREVGKAAAAAAAAKKAEGSGAAAAAAGGSTPAYKSDALECAHQMHGAVAPTVAAGVRTLTLELEAALPPAAGAPHGQPLLAALRALTDAAATLTAASAARAALFGGAAAAAAAAAPAATSPSRAESGAAAEAGALALSAGVDAFLAALATEAATLEAGFSAREVAAAVEAAAKEERRKAAAAAREQAEAARVAAMSPEERAKWEAAEAKKKAKVAASAPPAGGDDAAAADGSSPAWKGKNLLQLGGGVAEFRGLLRARGGVAAPGAQTTAESIGELTPAFACALWPWGRDAPLPRLAVALRATLDRIGTGGARRKAKIPKGTRDYMPEQMEVREAAFSTIRRVFKRHGACEIDTPVFENRETLMGKYGEEGGKLIYDLADQGGELLSLRYDLTVPFARFLALHGVDQIKRYHIARVYRRDNPAMNRGRYREFYQCDFDIAGSYAPMMPDAEIITVATEILNSLPIGDFTIKLNHRGLLDATLDICGVPASKFRPICSAIDKLDKEPWSAVREEMIVEKGLEPAVADRIGTMVTFNGPPKELLARLEAEGVFGGHAGATAALDQLRTLFTYLEAMGSLPRVTFDLSLARGLDYYTGVIYEAVLLDPSVGVGSIAAGGRYDNLVGMFGSTSIPCVGVSIGVERVFAIMEARAAADGGLRRQPVSVLVASIPSSRWNMNVERMRLCAELWAANIPTEMVFANDPKLQKQVTAGAEGNVPYVVVLGEDELDKGAVQLKDMVARTAETVPRSGLVAALLAKGARVVGASASAAAAAAPAAPAAAAPAAATAAAPAGGAASGGSVGVVREGEDRLYGRFTRPAKL